MPDFDYSRPDLDRAYAQLLAHQPRVVMVRSDLRWLGRFESAGKEALLAAHFEAIMNQLQRWNGTLVVSTATISFCNTEKVFDPANTPSEMGVFSEFVRKRPEAQRSFHPFISYAAVGPLARELTENIGRHGFGPCSPKARMIAHDACSLSVGVDPRVTCTTVHHVELVSAVPYRYVKEFMQPVQRPGGVQVEPFYLYVWYRDVGIKRDHNRKLFTKLAAEGFDMESANVGRGQIHAYSMRQFFDLSLEAFREDPYIWLENLPLSRPYQN